MRIRDRRGRWRAEQHPRVEHRHAVFVSDDGIQIHLANFRMRRRELRQRNQHRGDRLDIGGRPSANSPE